MRCAWSRFITRVCCLSLLTVGTKCFRLFARECDVEAIADSEEGLKARGIFVFFATFLIW